MMDAKPSRRWTAFGARAPAAPAWLLALAIISSGSVTVTAAECPSKPHNQILEPTQPRNLGELKRQLLDYKCFGRYDRDVARVLASARRYVEMRARAVNKPALVLDVDETALSNWPQLLANDFGYIVEGGCDLRPKFPCGVNAWELSSQAQAIKPTLELFNAAQLMGVAVFFITGRHDADKLRAATEKNLEQAGYKGWTALIMRPPTLAGVAAAKYKSAERAKIEKRGHRIIANVGDQWSDLRGGYAERRFRVPNPFYFIP